jgi:hypothetical protein
MIRKDLSGLIIVVFGLMLNGCTLDPNWVNRDANMVTFTMCDLPEGLELLQGVRYSYWVSDVFLKPYYGCGRLQYYKHEDNVWIHASGPELRIEGNLYGSHDHYNMNINNMYDWLLLLDQDNKEWRKSRGERFSYSLDKVVKNNMLCIRRETVLRKYNARPKPNKDYSNCPAYHYDAKTGRSSGRIPRHQSDECKDLMSQSVIGQLAVKNIEYYCWSPSDNLNHYVKIGAKDLSGFDIPDEKYDRYQSHIKRVNMIPEEEDEYANAPLEYKYDMEKEMLDPVFETLTVRPVSDEIKQRLDAQWKFTCESRMKTFEDEYVGKDRPAVKYRRMYLENCGYTVQ